MASSSPPAFTNCPRCACLCVGPILLACGHILCRKCLRNLVGQNPAATCPVHNCNELIVRNQEQTINESLKALGRDFVLEELVLKRLAQQRNVFCQGCSTRPASRVCADCAVMYCQDCGETHTDTEARRDHQLQNLARGAQSATDTSTHQTFPKTAISTEQFQLMQRVRSRRSDVEKSIRVVQNITEKLLPALVQNLNEKKGMLTRYSTCGAVVGADRSVEVRINTLLDYCRPPSLEGLLKKVNMLVTLRPQTPVLPRRDIAGRHTQTAQMQPVRSGCAPTIPREMYYADHVETLQVLNVEVMVKHDEDDDTQRKDLHSREPSDQQSGVVLPSVNIRHAGHVVMEAHSTTINIGQHLAHLEVITDTDVKQAVTDALIAKITWKEARERELAELNQQYTEELRRVQDEIKEARLRREGALEEARFREESARQETESLKSQLSEAEARGWEGIEEHKRFVERLALTCGEREAAEQRVTSLSRNLQEEKRKGEMQIADINQRHEEEKTKLKEQVVKFVVQVEEVHRLSVQACQQIDQRQLRDVIQRLLCEFNVRLCGVDCGLRFLLDAPVSQWVNVEQRQLEIQRLLLELVPETVRPQITLTDVTQCAQASEDIHLRLGQPLPPLVTSSARETAVDPLPATVRRLFYADANELKAEGDIYRPWITSLVVTDQGRVVMVDCNNSKVKVMDSRPPASVRALSLKMLIYNLAVCHDGLIAVTSLSDCVIHLIDITRQLRIVNIIRTARQYQAVGCGGKDGTLVVGGKRTIDKPASVDIISRDGILVRSVVEGDALPGLRIPMYLCVSGGAVLVSGAWNAKCVYQVDLATGQVEATHRHEELFNPHQVAVDTAGNLYVASAGGRCVLMMRQEKRWRTLLRGAEEEELLFVWPKCVAVTSTGFVVGFCGKDGSVMAGFELK